MSIPDPSNVDPNSSGERLEFCLALPDWLEQLRLGVADRRFDDDEARMGWVVDLARRNVAEGTGGPFAAAVFDGQSGFLVAPGVNLVVTARASIAHAEVVALTLAQRRLVTHDLGSAGSFELFTSTEPCAMCLGSIPWSGVKRVVCAAAGEDAESIGFDEGAKPTDWVASLENRGIRVVRELLREQGRAVLSDYAASGGIIY
ncbi:MAG: nucleoside deaminase [Thermoanaerobaculia bacterium]|nr:nucleoside deaminase [Thermoanaerobaculia bacterium]